MLYLILIALSYAIFVFVAENFNPFARKVPPFKVRRLSLGRQMAVIVLFVGVPCLSGYVYFGIEKLILTWIFLVVSIALFAPCLLRYRKKNPWY